ncbi:MAG: hypothetical protein CVU39_09845 [Chloroflexi bacterium HGW-Chloroflexi-10]|nr:MAG: hypothetical protein CVU39_09845 [Chloroflexi bacterium HGW-Chloroflexi-10]
MANNPYLNLFELFLVFVNGILIVFLPRKFIKPFFWTILFLQITLVFHAIGNLLFTIHQSGTGLVFLSVFMVIGSIFIFPIIWVEIVWKLTHTRSPIYKGKIHSLLLSIVGLLFLIVVYNLINYSSWHSYNPYNFFVENHRLLQLSFLIILAFLCLNLFKLRKLTFLLKRNTLLTWWNAAASTFFILSTYVLLIFFPFDMNICVAELLLSSISGWLIILTVLIFNLNTRYEQIFDSLDEAILRLNSKKQLLNANTRAREMFGIGEKEFGSSVSSKILDKIPVNFDLIDGNEQPNIYESHDQQHYYFVDIQSHMDEISEKYHSICIRDITNEVNAKKKLERKITEFESLNTLSIIANSVNTIDELFSINGEIIQNLLGTEQIIVFIQKTNFCYTFGKSILTLNHPIIKQTALQLEEQQETTRCLLKEDIQSEQNYTLAAFQIVSNKERLGNFYLIFSEENSNLEARNMLIYQLLEQLGLSISKNLIISSMENSIEIRTKELSALNNELHRQIKDKELTAQLLGNQKFALERLVRELNYFDWLNKLVTESNFPVEMVLKISTKLIAEVISLTNDATVNLQYMTHHYCSKERSFEQSDIEVQRQLMNKSRIVLQLKYDFPQQKSEKDQETDQRFMQTVVEQLFVLIENRLTKKKLEDNLEFMQVLIDTIPNPVFYKTTDGIYLGCNKLYASQMFGVDKKEVIGKEVFEFTDVLNPELAILYTQKDKELFDNPGIQVFEAHVHCADGVERDYLYNKQTYQNTNGEVAGIVGILSDITPLKQVTKELSRLVTAVEFAGEAIVMISLSGSIEYLNQEFSKVIGFDKETVLQTSFDSLLYRTDDQQSFVDMIHQTRNKSIWEGHFAFQSDDKHVLEHSVTAAPIEEKDGTIRDIVLVMRDVSNIQKMELRLHQAQKLEAIGQLAAGIAHEINTPTQYVYNNTAFLQEAFEDISKILSYLDVLKSETVVSNEIAFAELVRNTDLDFLKSEIPAAIEGSIQGLQRITNIVSAMKEFSHPGTVEMVLMDINHNIENTIIVSRNEWKYIADLEFNKQENLPQILCLPGEFNQVVLNLIVNAAHAIEEHKKNVPTLKGKITVSTESKNESIIISIRDNGYGIPLNIQDKIFDPFFTTKRVGKGTGQGLSIAYDVIVNKLNGKIWFVSETSVGTTFYLQIPCPICKE